MNKKITATAIGSGTTAGLLVQNIGRIKKLTWDGLLEQIQICISVHDFAKAKNVKTVIKLDDLDKDVPGFSKFIRKHAARLSKKDPSLDALKTAYACAQSDGIGTLLFATRVIRAEDILAITNLQYGTPKYPYILSLATGGIHLHRQALRENHKSLPAVLTRCHELGLDTRSSAKIFAYLYRRTQTEDRYGPMDDTNFWEAIAVVQALEVSVLDIPIQHISSPVFKKTTALAESLGLKGSSARDFIMMEKDSADPQSQIMQLDIPDLETP